MDGQKLLVFFQISSFWNFDFYIITLILSFVQTVVVLFEFTPSLWATNHLKLFCLVEGTHLIMFSSFKQDITYVLGSRLSFCTYQHRPLLKYNPFQPQRLEISALPKKTPPEQCLTSAHLLTTTQGLFRLGRLSVLFFILDRMCFTKNKSYVSLNYNMRISKHSIQLECVQEFVIEFNIDLKLCLYINIDIDTVFKMPLVSSNI